MTEKMPIVLWGVLTALGCCLVSAGVVIKDEGSRASCIAVGSFLLWTSGVLTSFLA